MEQATVSPLRFSEVFRHGVDEKRRIQIPAKWRPKEGEVEFAFVIWKQVPEGPCIRALGPQLLDKLVNDLTTLPPEMRMRARRAIGRDTAILTVDKSGRVCLPENHCEAAGIKSEVVLVGLIDRFEIWSPERYRAVEAADEAAEAAALKLVD